MLRKHKSYIGMAIAVAALVVAMVVSFQRMTVLQDRATVEARAALWLLSQLETEFLRFRETVTAYYAGDAQTDRRILDARFDILWSRLPLFLEGAESAALRDLEGLTQTVEMLLMTLHDLEPAVIALRPGNTMAYNEIVAGLEPFDEPLSDLSVRAYHQSAWYVNLRDDRTLLARIETAAAFIAIILGVGIFIYLLTRQMGRTESLLANTIAAQRSARASERRFKDVAEAASDWFWETDSQLCFTHISDRYRQITEKSGVEMIGKRREDIYRDALEADRDAWNGYFAKTAAQEDFRDFVHADLNDPNQLRVLRNSGKAIFDEQGHFTGYRGTSTDVSSEVEAREAAEAAKEQLAKAQKMQAVGQLTGGITHDFNNLLSVISGNAAILKKNLDGPDETLQAIIGAADRGADLTRRLRTFSRHQPLDPVAVDIEILITETAPMLRRTLGGTIEIETRLGEGAHRRPG
jgi:PAS domain-containing protein